MWASRRAFSIPANERKISRYAGPLPSSTTITAAIPEEALNSSTNRIRTPSGWYAGIRITGASGKTVHLRLLDRQHCRAGCHRVDRENHGIVAGRDSGG